LEVKFEGDAEGGGLVGNADVAEGLEDVGGGRGAGGVDEEGFDLSEFVELEGAGDVSGMAGVGDVRRTEHVQGREVRAVVEGAEVPAVADGVVGCGEREGMVKGDRLRWGRGEAGGGIRVGVLQERAGVQGEIEGAVEGREDAVALLEGDTGEAEGGGEGEEDGGGEEGAGLGEGGEGHGGGRRRRGKGGHRDDGPDEVGESGDGDDGEGVENLRTEAFRARHGARGFGWWRVCGWLRRCRGCRR
jgi:hypothetical protein